MKKPQLPGGAKNPKLFDGAIGLKESNSKIGNG
jgi:hypothetical protein